MNNSVPNLLYGVGERIINYLPNLLGGIVLLALGWILGWVAKRVVFQICLVLRLDRMLRRVQWGRGFSKADARYALYDTIGNLAFFVVFLSIVSAALSTMKLTILSDLLHHGVLFIPRFLIALLIIGVGVVVAHRVAESIHRGLSAEDVPRARLIARLAKGVMILFVAAMALTELDIARQIVLIGFATVMITICVVVVLLAGLGGHGWMARLLEKRERNDGE
jgi:hypothetical protein